MQDDRRYSTESWLILAVVLVFVVVALFTTGARGHEHHRHHAEFYSKWKTPHGTSCCNNSDCAPISDKDVRVQGEAIEVRIEGEWTPVPADRIRPYQAPDMNSHLCNVGKHIYCFVFGGGV